LRRGGYSCCHTDGNAITNAHKYIYTNRDKHANSSHRDTNFYSLIHADAHACAERLV
jgi:hypothetical protein